MDEDFNRERRRRRLFLLVGVVLALGASLVTLKLVQDAQSTGAAVVPTRSVLVAARTIPARTILQASDLTLRAVPVDPTFVTALTDPNLVIGRITSVEIPFQQPIMPNLLAATVSGAAFSILGPQETVGPDSPALRAVAIQVPDNLAVGGVVLVGAHVDVFVTVQINVTAPGASGSPGPVPTPTPVPSPGANPSPNGDFYTDRSTKIVYQDIPVLAKNGTLYILRVDERTAEEISHLSAAGNAVFSLALRPDQDTRQVDTKDLGETTNLIIEKYGLPIPRIYPLIRR